jgi:tetratricopeptide (TPR) repeat protein
MPKKLLACAALLLLTGCANRAMLRFDKIGRLAAQDDYSAAIQAIRKQKDLYGGQSQLLFNMDLGLLYHYAGQYDSSLAYLSRAAQIQDELFARSITNEALSLITNDNARPYRGRPHEVVMLHQYLAFDYLALGKYDDALVEARQAQLYIDELKRKEGPNGKGYADDGMYRYFSALAYDAARQRDDAAIAYYQAVKAYLKGPVPLPPEVAREAYQVLRAAGREDDIRELGLKEAVKGAAPAPDAGAGQSEIIVVGSAGRAPSLGQTVFWGTWVRDGMLIIHYHNSKGEEVTEALPAPGLPQSELEKAQHGRKTRSGTTVHIKFAMPEIRKAPSRTRFFSVAGEASPTPVRTEALTDLDTLAVRNLEDTHGSTLMRTVIRVVLRTVAAQETKDALSGGNPLVNLLFNVGTDALADQLEQADTRSWFLLPRTVQVARIPVKPGVHSFTVEAHDANGATISSKTFSDVEVKPGEKKFVFCSSLQ